jgi:hypothetical protein
MNLELKKSFLEKWKMYFGKSELPITFYFSEDIGNANCAAKPKGHSCLLCDLSKVREGNSLVYNLDNLGCNGAKRYAGYVSKIPADFKYFLSCGIPGIMEGERYLKTPELVVQLQRLQKKLHSEGKNMIFKRWDKLEETDNPEVVIFFAKPDVLSGLFTLANFDQIDPVGTFCPFGAGCGSIIHYPYLEKDKIRPRAVIGMFDPSARPCVPFDVLTFAVPMVRFERMICNMDESFLITETWNKVLKRISKSKAD